MTIFGIRDGRASLPSEHLAEHCRIVRVPFRAREQAFFTLFWLVLSTIPALALAALAFRSFGAPENTLVRTAGAAAVRAFDLVRSYPDRLIIAAIALFLLDRGLRRARTAYRHYQGYRRIEGNPAPPGPIATVRQGARAARIILGRTIRFGIAGKAVLKELQRLEPDVVHCHDLLTLPVGVRFKKHSSCTLVYDSHEIFEEVATSSPVLRFYYRRLQRRCSGFVDAFVTVNDSITEFLGRRYPELPNAVVVKNAADPPPSPKPEYDGRLHEAAGLDRNRKILLYQGGFSTHRGLEHLIGATSRLPADWCIVLMGWGKLEPALRRRARAEDPQGRRVFFLPPVPPAELLGWTAGAAAGIIPYEDSCLNHRFCTPNKLWEYPAAGVPLIVADLPELRRVVEEYDVGWVIAAPTSAESIAACVSGISATDLLRKSSNCDQFISRDNWTVYQKRLLDLYAGFPPPDRC